QRSRLLTMAIERPTTRLHDRRHGAECLAVGAELWKVPLPLHRNERVGIHGRTSTRSAQSEQKEQRAFHLSAGSPGHDESGSGNGLVPSTTQTHPGETVLWAPTWQPAQE